MNILVSVSDRAWGGKQMLMLDLCHTLQRAGNSVRILAECGGELLSRARAAGFHVCAVPMDTMDDRGLAAVTAALAPADALVMSGQRDAAVLHRARGEVNWDGVTLLFRHSGFAWGGDLREIVARVDGVALMAEFQRKGEFAVLVAEGALREDQIRMVRSWVDPVRFSPRPPSGRVRDALRVAPTDVVIGAVGRLSWEKGHPVLVGAFAELVRAWPDLLLLIIGAGPALNELVAVARELGVADRVRLPGFRDDIPEVLSICRVVALPSIAGETGPLTLKEAMAMGIPVVASEIGGIPDFVTHEMNGLLVPPGDTAALAQAIGRLLSDEGLAASLAGAARAGLLEQHAPDLTAELERLELRSHGPGRFLRRFRWNDRVRIRAEAFGGLIFVPETSLVLPVDAKTYQTVERSLATGTPGALANEEGAVALAADLHRIGALLRL